MKSSKINIDQIESYRKASEDGSLPDDLNPVYLFSTTKTQLLVKLVKGDVNALDLVRYELAERGLDMEGKWIGFEAAKKFITGQERKLVKGKRKGKGL